MAIPNRIPNRIPTVTTIGLALEDTYISVRKHDQVITAHLEQYSGDELTISYDGDLIVMSQTGNITENAVLWQNMEHGISVIFKQN